MSLLQLPLENPSEPTDLAAHAALLNKFTHQICPHIHEQPTLLCFSLVNVFIQQMLIEVYLKYAFTKTTPDEPSNPQLDFLFHNFEPLDKETKKLKNLSTTDVLHLIQTGHPTKEPAETPTSLLPAPFWKFSEIETALVELIANNFLCVCNGLSAALRTDEPLDTETPNKTPSERLANLAIKRLTTFLSSTETTDESSDSLEPTDDSPESTKGK